jgi:hypothetical protein
MFIYIFTNSKKHFKPRNQKHTRNATLRQCELAADTPPKSGKKYRKSLLGTGNSLMILNTFVDSGRNERRKQLEQRYITYRCVRLLALSYPSVRQSTFISAACTDRRAVKFDIGDLHENLSRNSRLLTIGQNPGNAHKDLSVLYCFRRH